MSWAIEEPCNEKNQEKKSPEVLTPIGQNTDLTIQITNEPKNIFFNLNIKRFGPVTRMKNFLCHLMSKSSNIGKTTTGNQCKRMPDLWRPGKVKIERYYAKNGRLIPTAKRGKEIKQQ